MLERIEVRAVVRNDRDLTLFVSKVVKELGANLGDKPYTVSIKRFHRPRSLDQNKKLHAMIRELALHCGYAESQMKEIVKAQFGPMKAVKIGDRREVSHPKGTSEYTVQEMSDFMERLYQLAAEIGLVFQEVEGD